jgi:hypothetical protein
MSDFDSPSNPESASQNCGPDHIDRMVYTATHAVRRDYIEACARLGQRPRDLSPIVIGMRSVQ